MKIGKIMIIVALFIGTLANAQAITCKAQLVHTACGSGKIEISFDSKTMLFEFHNGDVRCWMPDYQVKGILEKKVAEYPFLLGNTFKLSILDDQTNQTVTYGNLVYDDRLKVARLELNPRYEYEKTNSKYDLTCE